MSPPSSTDLFPSSLLSPTVAADLPEGYTLRALRRDDYANGFLDVLRVLTQVGDITEAAWDERYAWMNSHGGTYYVIVVTDGAKVVATGTVVVERKL